MCEYRLETSKTKAINIHKNQWQFRNMEEEGDIIILDTGDRRNGNIKRREWHIFEYKNHKQRLMGYQDKSEGKFYPIVNAVTKAWFQ